MLLRRRCPPPRPSSPPLQTVIVQECGRETLFGQQLTLLCTHCLPLSLQTLRVCLTRCSRLPPQAEPADRVQESDFSQPAVCGVGLWTHQSQHADTVRSHLLSLLQMQRRGKGAWQSRMLIFYSWCALTGQKCSAVPIFAQLTLSFWFRCRYEQSEWGWKEREKREEMNDERAWYLLARDSDSAPVAFSHFRFDVECGEEVLYW